MKNLRLHERQNATRKWVWVTTLSLRLAALAVAWRMTDGTMLEFVGFRTRAAGLLWASLVIVLTGCAAARIAAPMMTERPRQPTPGERAGRWPVLRPLMHAVVANWLPMAALLLIGTATSTPTPRGAVLLHDTSANAWAAQWAPSLALALAWAAALPALPIAAFTASGWWPWSAWAESVRLLRGRFLNTMFLQVTLPIVIGVVGMAIAPVAWFGLLYGGALLGWAPVNILASAPICYVALGVALSCNFRMIGIAAAAMPDQPPRQQLFVAQVATPELPSVPPSPTRWMAADNHADDLSLPLPPAPPPVTD
ncbi:MAG: hypothetical protein AB7K09_10480 [Planctomycetota bacterium]